MPRPDAGRALGDDRPRQDRRSSSASRTAKAGDFVLPVTHEETVTFHARELQSYKQLPQMLVPLLDQGAGRAAAGQGPHPPARVHHEGLLLVRPRRGRARRCFERHRGAYHRIFERCGIEAYDVVGGVGDDGRQRVFRLPRARPARARTRWSPARTATTRPTSRSRAAFRPRREFPAELDAPEEVETPGQRTIESVAAFLGVDERATSKAMPVVPDGRVVLALVRGDDRLNEMKLLGELGEDFRPASEEEIRAAFGASGGSLGPVGRRPSR